jgi:hypothetical protein
VNAICPLDINNDGYIDLVLGGNQYEFKPQFTRLDSNFGSVLLGKGVFLLGKTTMSLVFLKEKLNI